MSHLHIAWYRKRGSRLPTVRAICEKFQRKAVYAPPLSRRRPVLSFLRFLSPFFAPVFFLLRPSGGHLIEETRPRVAQFTKASLSRCIIRANGRKGALSPRLTKPHFKRPVVHEGKIQAPCFPNSRFSRFIFPNGSLNVDRYGAAGPNKLTDKIFFFISIEISRPDYRAVTSRFALSALHLRDREDREARAEWEDEVAREEKWQDNTRITFTVENFQRIGDQSKIL